MKKFASLDSLVILYKKEKFNLSIKELLTIDEEALLSSLENTPMYIGYLSVLRNKLSRQAMDESLSLKNKIAETYIIAKEDDTWDKPPTEKHVESIINSDSDILEMRKSLATLESNIQLLDSLLESLRHKVALIQTLSANLRNN